MRKLFTFITILIIIIIFLLGTTYAKDNKINNDIYEGSIILKNKPNNTRDYTPPEQPLLNEQYFYIKNMLTGQYLTIQNGVAANNVNVQQNKYNGGMAQQWYVHYNGDGTYSIYTPLGNDGTFRYALDISGGSSANYANVQIYTPNGTNSQKFSLAVTSAQTYVIFTKVSNYEKAVVLNGPTYDEGRNVDQYTFQAHANECWIFEPVSLNVSLGLAYARTNYQQYITAYPRLTNFGTEQEADCANYVSQCMLAYGYHYRNNWYVYRKNDLYVIPENVTQLDTTWELGDPSPWISAKKFKNYWQNEVSTHSYKGNQIINNPSLAWNLDITQGDVIQICKSILGFEGDAQHTMIITGYSNNTYLLTYHSTPHLNRNLIDICNEYPELYYKFYEMI